MGEMQRKRHFIFILLAVVVSIGGVFSLIVSPAPALDDARCEAWAKEIKGRTEEIRDDPDFILGTVRGNSNCPNLCEDEQDGNSVTISPFLRQPAGVLAATITEILTSPGDKLFGPTFEGISAFFCVVPQIDAYNFTEAVVAAGHPAPTDCGTGYTEICRTTLSSPIPTQ